MEWQRHLAASTTRTTAGKPESRGELSACGVELQWSGRQHDGRECVGTESVHAPRSGGCVSAGRDGRGCTRRRPIAPTRGCTEAALSMDTDSFRALWTRRDHRSSHQTQRVVPDSAVGLAGWLHGSERALSAPSCCSRTGGVDLVPRPASPAACCVRPARPPWMDPLHTDAACSCSPAAEQGRDTPTSGVALGDEQHRAMRITALGARTHSSPELHDGAGDGRSSSGTDARHTRGPHTAIRVSAHRAAPPSVHRRH